MTQDAVSLSGLKSDLDALGRRLAELGPRFQSTPMDLLHCVLVNMPAIVAMLAPDGKFLFINRVNPDMQMEDVLGKSAVAFALPEYAETVRATIERVVSSGRSHAVEVEARQRDGSSSTYDARFGPVFDGDEVIAVTLIATDVTGRIRVDRALRESEEKLRMAVAAAGMALWSWDTRTDVVLWDDRACEILGVPPGKGPAGSSDYLGIVHPDDRERVSALIQGGMTTGVWEDAEYRIVRPDGAIRWILAKGAVMRAPDGSIATVLGGVIDVTERRQRDEQLRQAQKLEAVGQLTAGIAHNFNNMLMGILPNLELAARDVPAGVLPLLQSAEHAAQRAADLVRQLMTYAGRNRPAARRVESIEQLVERTVSICRTTFDRRIAFETRCDPGACANLDPAQLEQALLNILINARDALHGAQIDRPQIAIHVDVVRDAGLRPMREPVDVVRIRITDNGAGMSEDTRAHIFEPFFTTKDVGEGTGLGLATTQAIVRDHGGWVECDSTQRRGTTFAIHLPSARFATAARSAREPAPPGGTETVLVIDDEPAILGVVQQILTGAGYTVKIAASGEEALVALALPSLAERIALILLDVSMPGIPTVELRKRLRDRVPNASVVYFTGYAFEAPEGDLVLEKPVTHAQLLGAVSRAIARSDANPCYGAPASSGGGGAAVAVGSVPARKTSSRTSGSSR